MEQALGFGQQGILDRRQAAGDTVGGIESSLFDQMGRMQLQTEQDIASRRMQALRSGMPSSQLAAMELQNVQQAQIGAQQMSREYDQLRAELGMETAGAEGRMGHEMFQTLAQGRIDSEAIDAQRFPHDIAKQLEGVAPEAFEQLSEGDRMTLMLGALGFMESDSPEMRRVLSTLAGYGGGKEGHVGQTGVFSGEPISQLDGKESAEKLRTYNPHKDKGVDFSDNAKYFSTRASTEEIEDKLPVSPGSSQEDWINYVKSAAVRGDIAEGDVVDFAYGKGSALYMYLDGHFVELNQITGNAAKQSLIDTYGGALKNAEVVKDQGINVHFASSRTTSLKAGEPPIGGGHSRKNSSLGIGVKFHDD